MLQEKVMHSFPDCFEHTTICLQARLSTRIVTVLVLLVLKSCLFANCDHDKSICDSKIQVSSVEKLLGVTISNTLCQDAHINQPIKKCNSYLFLLSRIKVFLSRIDRQIDSLFPPTQESTTYIQLIHIHTYTNIYIQI